MSIDPSSDSTKLAEKIDQFFTSNPGMATLVAQACKVTKQSVSGWRKTGRIRKKHWATLVRLSGKSIEWWLDSAPDPSAMGVAEAPLLLAWRWLLPEEQRSILAQIQEMAAAHQRSVAAFSKKFNIQEVVGDWVVGQHIPPAPAPEPSNEPKPIAPAKKSRSRA